MIFHLMMNQKRDSDSYSVVLSHRLTRCILNMFCFSSVLFLRTKHKTVRMGRNQGKLRPFGEGVSKKGQKKLKIRNEAKAKAREILGTADDGESMEDDSTAQVVKFNSISRPDQPPARPWA